MMSLATSTRYKLILSLLVCCLIVPSQHTVSVYGFGQSQRRSLNLPATYKRQRWPSLIAAIVNYIGGNKVSACDVFEKKLKSDLKPGDSDTFLQCCAPTYEQSPSCKETLNPSARELTTLLREFGIQSRIYPARDFSLLGEEYDGDVLFVVGGIYSYSLITRVYSRDIKRYDDFAEINTPGIGRSRVRINKLLDEVEDVVKVFNKEDKNVSTSEAEASAAETAQREDEIRQNLDAVESEFKSDIGRLKLYKGSLAQGVIIEGYKVSEFTSTLERQKEKLSAIYDKPELSGLKDYVEKFFPSPKGFDTFKMLPNQQQAALRDVSQPPVVTPMPLNYMYNLGVMHVPSLVQEDNDLVRPESSESWIGTIITFINKLRQNSSAIDLRIVSNPGDAKIELLTSRGVVRTSTTPATFRNLFRGDYGYAVSKNGYKDIRDFSLNLVDDSGTRLRCKLYASDQAEGPNPCTLQ